MKQVRGKGPPKQAKDSETAPAHTIRKSPKNNNLHTHILYVKDLGQIHTNSLLVALVCESLWVQHSWFCEPCSCGVHEPLGSSTPSSTFSMGLPEQCLMLGCGSLLLLSSVCWMKPLWWPVNTTVPGQQIQQNIVRNYFIDFLYFLLGSDFILGLWFLAL